MAPRTTIICVSYNSALVLDQMLKSAPSGALVVVVDNGSSDNSVEVAKSHNARCVELQENLGFGAACNKGAELAETEFLLFLNPDACLQNGALQALEDAADRYPNAVAFNPVIIEADGRVFYRRSSQVLERSKWGSKTPPSGDATINVLSGAALFCRRDAFETIKGFDERLFLFFEDDDLALRLSDLGPLMRIERAMVLHSGGNGSGSSLQTLRFKAFHMARSRVVVCQKHGRPQPILRTALTAFRKMLDPKNLFSSAKRAQTAGYVQGLLSILRHPQ